MGTTTAVTPAPVSVNGRATVAPYAGSIFLGAILLFLVQPMIARELLPRFGGAASVWTACLMFFQFVLLLGYLYADWSTRNLTPLVQGGLHILLIAAGAIAAWVPLGAAAASGTPDHPVAGVLRMLAVSVGLPYLVLSTTSPLMQSWCAAAERRPIPYRFYALSNLGSLIALLGYPLVLEPMLELTSQFRIWRVTYLLFALFAVAAALRVARSNFPVPKCQASGGHTSLRQKLGWIVMAACPSALLLAVTNELCQNIAPVPLLWIAPLAIYLITFIVCFDRGPLFGNGTYRILMSAALAGLLWVEVHSAVGIIPAVLLILGGLFVVAMFCHSRLAGSKPEGAGVTSFYLCISIGGAAGGLFVGLAAPALFSDYFELEVLVVVAFVLMLRTLFGYEAKWFLGVCATLGLAMLYIMGNMDQIGGRRVFQGRNFYGAVAVREDGELRRIIHGKTIHGSQLLARPGVASPVEPTTYYGRKSGAGLALSRGSAPRRVGAIGLGVGTVAAYGQPGDQYRFFEINPLVEDLARNRFGFLKGSGAKVDVSLGDARLALEAESDLQLDTLVLDAFSGDSIPVHLLTREAFQLYFRQLKPDGVLAVHVSNHYLDLPPLVARLGAEFGRQALRVDSEPVPDLDVINASWVLVSGDAVWLAGLEGQGLGKRLAPAKSRVWTDQYSNVLSVLKW